MRRIRAFLAFCYDFVVGDDWRLALGVVAGLCLTAAVVRLGWAGWWPLPICAAAALGLSLQHAAVRAPGADRPPGAHHGGELLP